MNKSSMFTSEILVFASLYRVVYLHSLQNRTPSGHLLNTPPACVVVCLGTAAHYRCFIVLPILLTIDRLRIEVRYVS